MKHFFKHSHSLCRSLNGVEVPVTEPVIELNIARSRNEAEVPVTERRRSAAIYK